MEVRYKQEGSQVVPVVDQYIYAIQCASYVKIGYSIDVKARLGGIQTSNPLEVELLGTITGGPQVEKKIHDHLAEHLERGEWFRLDNDDVLEVVRMIMHKDMVALDKFMPDEDEMEEDFKELLGRCSEGG